MKAGESSLKFLCNEGVVRIPFFQRAYVWTESNWDELLSDLLKINKKNFLGSIILKPIPKSGRAKEVLVIDGQQRLTTLSILVRALYNSFDKETQKNCEQELNAFLFYKENVTDRDLLVKITHSKVDKQYYEIVIRNMVNKDVSRKSNIVKCFDYFINHLYEISLGEKLKLFNKLLDFEHKILVLIDLDESDDEQAIFDTINSAGVRLSSADIIKNSLFQRAFDVMSHDEVESLYSENWERVFCDDEEAVLYWDKKRATGRFYRDNVELLLHSIAVINGFFDPDKHSLSDLSDVYKKHLASLNYTNLIQFIKDIKAYAKLYRDKIIDFENSHLFYFSDFEARLLHILNTCEISTFHPYILHIYKRFSTNTAVLKEHLHKVEKLVVRRMIAGKSTKNYNKLCKDFIAEDAKIDTILAETTDKDVRNGMLSCFQNGIASLLLFWIELFRRDRDIRYIDKDSLKYSYTLEHIMPKKWEEYWSNIPIVGINGAIIPDKHDAEIQRNTLIHTIGNMTLLKGSLNTSVRNYEFARKIEGDGSARNFIKRLAELGITKFDIVEPYEKGDKIWNEQKIYNRTLEITNDVLKIW